MSFSQKRILFVSYINAVKNIILIVVNVAVIVVMNANG